MIERVEIFHVLTNTDSTSLKFLFISDLNSKVPGDKFRDLTLPASFGIFWDPEKKINKKN